MVEITSSSASMSLNWRGLLHLSAGAGFITLVATALILGDLLAGVLAVVVLAGLALLRLRGGWIGIVLLGLVFVDIAVWTLSGAVSNLLRGERFVAILIPSALAAISLAGAISAGAILVRRRDPSAGEKWSPLTGLGALALFLLLAAAGAFVRAPEGKAVLPTDITLEAENMAFSSQALAADAGQITVHLDNHDLWWHTFTIDELGIDLQVPMGGEQQVTFEAPPGEYRFYCGIPGHESIGMEGTLEVRARGAGE